MKVIITLAFNIISDKSKDSKVIY